MENSVKKQGSQTVTVEFNQQQEVILKQLAEDGRYGNEYSEILQNVFQELIRQTRI
jgi:Arc/MetJ-type ribon-helix-helix transcriptional regulator